MKHLKTFESYFVTIEEVIYDEIISILSTELPYKFYTKKYLSNDEFVLEMTFDIENINNNTMDQILTDTKHALISYHFDEDIDIEEDFDISAFMRDGKIVLKVELSDSNNVNIQDYLKK